MFPMATGTLLAGRPRRTRPLSLPSTSADLLLRYPRGTGTRRCERRAVASPHTSDLTPPPCYTQTPTPLTSTSTAASWPLLNSTRPGGESENER